MRNLPLIALLLAIFLLVSTQAAAATKQSPCARPPRTPFTYHWPVKPFDRQHPIRGAFGDPRTVNLDQQFGWTGRHERGAHSFHNGVDIVAKPGTPVYPVVSGQVVVAEQDKIIVHTYDDRSFQYYHLFRAVRRGQFVVVERTVLGWVQARYGHVHLAEIDGGLVHNPLDPGHLEPYRDRTTPKATGLYLDNGPQPLLINGSRLRPQDHLAVGAVDLPTMALPGPSARTPADPGPRRVAPIPQRRPWPVEDRRRLPEDPTPTMGLLVRLRPGHLSKLTGLLPPPLPRHSWPLPVPG